MSKFILSLCFSAACIGLANAQTTQTHASGDIQNQASASTKHITLDSGTRLSGELQNSIDVRKAKVGDQVVLRTTQALKSGGQTVVKKGSRLIGHVTDVAQTAKGKGESRVGLLFDRLEQGSLQMPIAASITAVTGVSARAAANGDDMFASENNAGASARSSSSARGSNGGLLGGVGGVVNSTTSTAGTVVGSTTSAVGSTVNTTTETVGGATSRLGRSLGGIRISESSSSSLSGASVLSLQGQNLRLEKGTNFQLVLTQSATVGAGHE